MTMAQRTGSTGSIRAMQAWAPGNGIGWYMQGVAAADPNAALVPLRRAYELTPFDTQVAGAFAGGLLAAGKREEARGVALAVRSGNNPVHDVESKLILLRVKASEARFDEALTQALT